MGSKKGSKQGTTTTGTTTGTTPTQYFTPPPKVTVTKKGTSTVPNPVGTTWGVCMGLVVDNGGNHPGNPTLKGGCYKVGVTYYTVRTQVGLFNKWWYHGGTTNPNNPVGTPNGFTPPTTGVNYPRGGGKGSKW